MKGPSWAKGCSKCKFGKTPSGGYCDCKAGRMRAQSEAEQAGRGFDPLVLDPIPLHYRRNTWESVLSGWRDLGEVGKVQVGFNFQDRILSGGSALLYGPVGTGKTTLAMLAVRHALESGVPAMVFQFYEWLNRVQGMNFEEQAGEIDRAGRVPFLLIDDLGNPERRTGRSLDLETARRIEILRNILDTRIAEERQTVITLNILPGRIAEQFGDRVGSRLSGISSFQLNGIDLRGVNYD